MAAERAKCWVRLPALPSTALDHPRPDDCIADCTSPLRISRRYAGVWEHSCLSCCCRCCSLTSMWRLTTMATTTTRRLRRWL